MVLVRISAPIVSSLGETEGSIRASVVCKYGEASRPYLQPGSFQKAKPGRGNYP